MKTPAASSPANGEARSNIRSGGFNVEDSYLSHASHNPCWRINASAIDQRADIARLSESLKADLTAKGITFIDVDRATFRNALAATPFYAEWKQKYGDAAWGLMEKAVGKLG